MATPTLVQSVSSGMDAYGLTTLKLTFPNPSLASNLLLVAFQFNSAGSVTSVKDSNGTSWTAGPTDTNVANTQKIALYYLGGAPSGTTSVTITVSGLNGAFNSNVQAHFEEWYNLATSAVVDVSSHSNSTIASGSITTHASGELIWHWGVAVSANTANGGAFNGTTSITPAPGFTLLMADLQVGACAEYQIQGAIGAINPSFSPGGSATWASILVAFKSAAAGTAPSATAIRIANVQHTLLCANTQSRYAPIAIQFPTQGNLLVGVFTSADVHINKITDSLGNAWSVYDGLTSIVPGPSSVAQIVYADNASTSAGLSAITTTLSGVTVTDAMLVIYDIVNADTSPLANAMVTTGNQSTVGNLTSMSGFSPMTPNGLVISTMAVYWQTYNGITTPGAIFDGVVNAFDQNISGGTSPSPMDEDNAYGHIYNSTIDPISFTWTSQGGTASYLWSAATAAFNAMGQKGSTPVLVQGPVSGSSGVNVTTCSASFLNATTTGNTIVVGSNAYNAAAARTVSGISINNGSATFSKIGSQPGILGGYGPMEGWAAANITGGATPTVTITYSGTVTGGDLYICEFTSMPSTVTTDVVAGLAGAATQAMVAPSITTTNPGDVIFALFAPNQAATSGKAGWIFIEGTNQNSGFEFITVGVTQNALVASATQSFSVVYGALVFALEGILIGAGPTGSNPLLGDNPRMYLP